MKRRAEATGHSPGDRVEAYPTRLLALHKHPLTVHRVSVRLTSPGLPPLKA